MLEELANCILLDDVTDVFYRSLAFSAFIRSEHDAMSDTEAKLDDVFAKKLVRQLNWTSSLCALDPSIHKISNFIEQISQRKMTLTMLENELQDNYWLADAFDRQMPGFSQQPESVLPFVTSGLVSEPLARTIWLYFENQVDQSAKHQIHLMAQLTELMAGELLEQAKQGQDMDQSLAWHMAFIHTLPMVILIKLFDRTLRSVIQSEMNSVAFECETLRNQIRRYQPTAEMALNFLKFDEFVKPHVLESMDLLGRDQVQLAACDEAAEGGFCKKVVQARNFALCQTLKPHNVLTVGQLHQYSDQPHTSFNWLNPQSANANTKLLWQKLTAPAGFSVAL